MTVSEVADTPGFGYSRRLDMVSIGCWGSNSLHTVGFEIKRSVSDWRKELEDPSKREPFVNEVNEFFYVAPWHIIDPKDVPEECGLLSINEGDELVRRKHPKQKQTTPSPAFMTALLKAALRTMVDTKLSQRQFASYRGKTLSVQDLVDVADNVSGYKLKHAKAAVERYERDAVNRRQTNQKWGQVVAQCVQLGRRLTGKWGSSEDEMTAHVKRALSLAEACSNEKVESLRTLAQRMRDVANELDPPKS